MASEERRTKSTEELINTLNDFCSQILIMAEAKGLTRKEVKRVPSWLDSMLTSESFNDDKYIFTVFSYNGALGRKLLSQCIYKVMGHDSNRTQYKIPHTRQKIGVYCTKAQKLEIELEFEFYERLFEEQQEIFLSAFIQKQNIFPPDAPVSDTDPTKAKDHKQEVLELEYTAVVELMQRLSDESLRTKKKER